MVQLIVIGGVCLFTLYWYLMFTLLEPYKLPRITRISIAAIASLIVSCIGMVVVVLCRLLFTWLGDKF